MAPERPSRLHLAPPARQCSQYVPWRCTHGLQFVSGARHVAQEDRHPLERKRQPAVRGPLDNTRAIGPNFSASAEMSGNFAANRDGGNAVKNFDESMTDSPA